MKYKTYGKLGYQVSSIGFGGMRFDLKNNTDAQNGDILKYAFDKGINYFDTAPGYCADKSEDIFGLGLKGLPRDKYFVATKLQPGSDKGEENFYKKILRSAERLGSGYIDFFHVWCLREMSQYHDAFDNGLYAALERAKREGVVKHIVFSSHLPGDGVRKIIEEGKFEGVLLGVNILNFPFRWDGVLAAQENGLGVIAMNPLAGGLIPQNEDKFKFLSSGSETPTEAALRFIAGAEAVTVGLVGFATRQEIDQACYNADLAQQLSNAEVKRLEQNLSGKMNAICTGCGYCDNCPQEIDIRTYMQFFNRKNIFDYSDDKMKEDLKIEKLYGILGPSAAHPAKNCIECGRCESDCTQHLPIIENLKKIAKWEEDGAAQN